MKNKAAVIAGVADQGGAYLAEFQIAKRDVGRTGGVLIWRNEPSKKDLLKPQRSGFQRADFI